MNQIEIKKKELEKILNLINVKKYEEVISKAKVLIKKFPHEYVFYNALGMALMNVARYDESLEILNKAIKLDEKNIHVLNNLGLVNGYLANYKKANEYYDRVLKIAKKDKIFVVSSKKYFSLIKKNIKGINNSNIIIEPSPKNTAPAIYIAAQHISGLDNDATLAIYPADHYIKKEDEFHKIINSIKNFINKNHNAIATIGVKPTYPATGFGYIKTESKEEFNGIKKIKSFIEKPNLDEIESLSIWTKEYLNKEILV